MYYKELFEALHRNNIRYLVAGGLAVVLKGIPRLTMDIDIIVDLEHHNLNNFIDTIVSLGYKPRIPVDPKEFLNADTRKKWRNEKNMVVFNFHHPKKPTEQIDVFTESPFSFDELFKTREIEHLGDIEIPLISTEYLIKLKRASGRNQDLSDIELLEKLENEE